MTGTHDTDHERDIREIHKNELPSESVQSGILSIGKLYLSPRYSPVAGDCPMVSESCTLNCAMAADHLIESIQMLRKEGPR